MLKMRLQRRGKKNYATFRVVVAEHTAPIKGKYVADIGWYNPHTNEFNVDPEQAGKWLGQGAQPSPTVHNLLVENGHLKADKITSWRKKKKKTESEGEGDAAPAAEGTAEDSKALTEAEPKAEEKEETVEPEKSKE